MQRLFGKLFKLRNLYKALGASLQPVKPTTSLPKAPKLGGIKTPKLPKIPGLTPKTQKNPVKVAQQYSSLSKEEDVYHLHVEGHVITDKPMTLAQITQSHGPINKLEASGVRVIKQSKKS